MRDNGKVLFIIHDLYQDDNHFPAGIGYLAAVLKRENTDVTVYNQDLFHFPNGELAKFLTTHSFDIIGIGFLAARFRETILDLCMTVTAHKKNAWLVLGGHGPSPIPEYILQTTQADAVVIGEGEETFVELLKCKLEGGNLGSIEGIAYREGNEVTVNKRRKPIKNLDTIPFPAWEIFPIEKYATCLKMFRMEENEKILGIVTSRGCINRCNFCYRMEKGIRFRSVKNVIQEIKALNSVYGITYFNMMDELFVYPKKRIFEFRDELENHDMNIKFSCNARVDGFDREIAECLKDCGCQFLNFGMESSCQDVLDAMKKRTTVAQNIAAAEISRNAGIGLGLNFIWNNLGDTEKSLKDNVALIKKYNTYDQIRTIRPVTPYPGCDLYYYAIDNGLLSGPDDFFNRFKNSDLITVNFMDIEPEKCYELLFEANKELILDYYAHTSSDTEEADRLIGNFYNLYFGSDVTFRGARHYSKDR